MQWFNPKVVGMCFLAALLGGCTLFNQNKPTVTLRIHEEVDTVMAGPRAMPVSMPNYDLTLSVDPQPALSEKYVKSAEIYPTAGGSAIMVRFDRHGMMALDEITTRLRGRRLVTFLNQRPVAVWLVNQRLTNGQFLVQGEFTDEEAKQAVDQLNLLGKEKD